jgi:twitching motility protein PilT
MIRENKNHQIDGVIQTSAAEGMCSMDQALAELCRAGRISADTAVANADNPAQLQRRLARNGN